MEEKRWRKGREKKGIRGEVRGRVEKQGEDTNDGKDSTDGG